MPLHLNGRTKSPEGLRSCVAWLSVLCVMATCGGAAQQPASAPGELQLAQADDLASRIRTKSAQVQQAVQQHQRQGKGVPPEVALLTRQVEPLLKQGKGREAEAALDRALQLLTAGGAVAGKPEAPAESLPTHGGGDTPPATPPKAAGAAERPARPAGGRAWLGLMPNAPDGNIGLIPSGFQDARANGVEVLYWYFSWRDLAESWKAADIVMRGLSEGGKTAVTFEVIHTTVQAQYPPPYRSFDDAGFAEAFASFAAEFVQRYRPDYVFVGNEANDYLRSHPNQARAYADLVRVTAEKIRKAKPSTRVGVTIAYHSALQHNQWDLVKSLAGAADLIGYTVYGYEDPDYRFEDPSAGIRLLERVGQGVPGKPYAIVETGWNSSPKLGSSEAGQAEFVKLFFDYLGRTNAEFVNWFIYQDGKDCTAMARTFLGPGIDPPPGKFETFKDFLCNFGLKDSNGRPKQAWRVWQERARAR